LAPRQEGWRRKRKSHPLFPKEWKHAIRDTWEDKLEALGGLPERTLERRRETFKSFYEEKKADWGFRLKVELSSVKDWNEDFKEWHPAVISRRKQQVAQWLQEREGKLEALTEPGVFSEQFPSGGRTTSSKDHPPSASDP
jgi:hypothetical protein